MGDSVWVIRTKDHFYARDYNKHSAKKIGPLEIIEKLNPNAYCLKFPSHIQTSDVFNVKHLIPYHVDSSDNDVIGNSRINFLHPGENVVVHKGFEFLELRDQHKSL